jgi:PAS domain S-box-containing protein
MQLLLPNIYSLLLMLALVSCLFVVWMAYRRTQRPIARRLGTMLLGAAISIIGILINQTVPEFDQKRLTLVIVYLGLALLLWGLPLFALEYAGMVDGSGRRIRVLMAIEPVLLVLAATTNDWHYRLWSGYDTIQFGTIVQVRALFGPLFWVHAVYAYLVLLFSTGLFLKVLLQTRGNRQIQSALALVGTVMPWAANLAYLVDWTPIDLTSVGIVITGLAYSVGVVRYHLFDLTPIARDAVIDVMDDGVIILDNEHQIVDLNQAARSIFMLVKEPVGIRVTDLIPQLDPIRHADHDDHPVVQIEEKVYEVHISPLRYANRRAIGRLIILHDVTLAQQAQAAIQAERDFALQVMNNMGQALSVTDKDFRFIYVNPAYGRITGFSPEEILGRTPYDFTPEDDLDNLAASLERRRTGEISSSEGRIKRADGSITETLITGVPRFKNGVYDGAIAVITDLTAQKQHEDELRQARDEAMQASSMKSVFLATMSHELRTPLTAIMGYAELQLAGITGPLNSEQQEYTDRILANSRHLLTIINQVLDISKIEAGKLELARVAFKPCLLLDEVLRQTASLIGEKPIDLEGECGGFSEELYGDPDRLRQVLLNLVSNAIKFTNAGCVRVRIVTTDEQHWQMIVQDSGIGIPAESLDCIFDEFRQVNTAVTRQHEGTGLGLAIVRKLVRLMGGEIQVASQVDHGSTFTVSLPVKPKPQDEPVSVQSG